MNILKPIYKNKEDIFPEYFICTICGEKVESGARNTSSHVMSHNTQHIYKHIETKEQWQEFINDLFTKLAPTKQ